MRLNIEIYLHPQVYLKMRYGVLFAILGGLSCYQAWSSNGFWFVLLWFGFNFFTLSAGYFGLGAVIFGKSPDGNIRWWSKTFYLPFHLYTNVIWHLVRVLSYENPFDKVSDNLYIGRRLLSSELPQGIINYVDLAAEFEEPKVIRQAVHYVSLPILDASVPDPKALTNAIDCLNEGVTYIHCAQGHGRTCLFTLAMLARQNHIYTLKEGFTHLKKIRPAITLNRTQESFIRKFISDQNDSVNIKP